MSWYLNNWGKFFETEFEQKEFDELWKAWNRSVGIENGIDICQDETIRLMLSFWKHKLQFKSP